MPLHQFDMDLGHCFHIKLGLILHIKQRVIWLLGVFTCTNNNPCYCLCTCFMLTPNTSHRSQIIWETGAGRCNPERGREKKTWKAPFWWILNGLESSNGHVDAVVWRLAAVSQQWIRSSRLQPTLDYVSAHSSQDILWIAILGCGLWTRRMVADYWQRAVAYNLCLPIGSVCSIRRRKGAEAAEGVRGLYSLWKKK